MIGGPDDHESRRSSADARIVVARRRHRVDAELAADRRAGAREELAPDAPSFLRAAHPDDEEVAAAVRRDGGIALRAGRIRVDAELSAERGAAHAESLAEDSSAVQVLPRAHPDDDERPGIPSDPHRDLRSVLAERR